MHFCFTRNRGYLPSTSVTLCRDQGMARIDNSEMQ